MNRRLTLLLVPLVAAYVLFPRATPRPAADIPSGVFTPAETDQQRTGAPQAVAVSPRTGLEQTPAGSTAAPPTPRPSGGIGQPASYCRPKFCETPPALTVYAGGISGTATYYCRPGISRCTKGHPFGGMYAAAGPELRAMLGDWRGRTVVVIDANGRGVLVQLIDWCACGGDHVIDLYWTAYQGLVNPVTVREQP